MAALSLATLNVNGMHNSKKRLSLYEWLQRKNFDVIFLQETHCHLARHEKLWSQEWPGKSLWSRGDKRSRGVSVLFKKNADFEIQNLNIDLNGRFIVFDCCVNNLKYRFVNLYAPNNAYDRLLFFKNLSKFADVDSENLIAGDFNCAFDSQLDRKNCTGKTDRGLTELKSFMKEFDLEDVWRRRNPNTSKYSWNRSNKASRIDFWLISKSLDNQVDNVDYQMCPFSDHDCVNIQLRITETKQGKGMWKMNRNAMESELFNESFKNWWPAWKAKKPLYDDLNKWWDVGKKKIKELAIQISLELRKNKMIELNDLEKKIAALHQESGKIEEMHVLKERLMKLYENDAEGVKIRSRVQWFEEGERSTKYFHNLEKRNGKDKAWERIYDEERNIITGTTGIMKEQVRFYEKLYRSQLLNAQDKNEFLSSVGRSLSENSRITLDSDITIDELKKAVDMMANNKSPGTDGIIIEFYKYFWDDIKFDVLEVFNHSFDIGSLPHTQYLAAIRLLFKKGEREDLRNWRPISLLNSDVKILSKVLANRLKKVLPEIIDVDQTGCIEGRFIGQNIRLCQDVIDKCEEDELILLLDQEKAFDKVEWDWLFSVLEKFGFTNRYISWIKIMYKKMKSCILTNGYSSKYFDISRGIRQGDSLSALLYVIQAEPLACLIRKTDEIQGIQVTNKVEVRISQYVDDTVLYLRHKNLTEKCLQIIEKFGKASGARLNKGKTVGLVMKESLIKSISGINVSLGPVKLLGIPVGKKTDVDAFWNNVIEKMEKRYNMWKNRNLSFAGKIHIIKSLGMSTIMYASNMIELSDKHIEKITKLNYQFLWGSKRNLLRKELCCLPRQLGGLNMIDVSTAIKAQRIKWLIRILQAPDYDNWKSIAFENIKCLDNRFGTDLFALKVDESTRFLDQCNISSFYKKILLDAQELKRKCVAKNQRQTIWCNSKIKFNGQPLAFGHWAKCGLLYLDQIIQNGKLNEYYIKQKLISKASYFFDIAKLKSAIPDGLLIDIADTSAQNLAETDNEHLLHTFYQISVGCSKPLARLTNKDVYNMFLLHKSTDMKSKIYWKHKLDDNSVNFDLWFRCNFTSSIIPRKCLDFNWKIFHGKVSTEVQLQKMKLSNGMCCLCKKEFENLEHLLIKCEETKTIWTHIEQMLCQISERKILVNMKLIFGGTLSQDDFTCEIIDLILSITRFMIWKRRNRMKYDNEKMDSLSCFKWTINEVKLHLDTLLKVKKIANDKNRFEMLKYVRNIL